MHVTTLYVGTSIPMDLLLLLLLLVRILRILHKLVSLLCFPQLRRKLSRKDGDALDGDTYGSASYLQPSTYAISHMWRGFYNICILLPTLLNFASPDVHRSVDLPLRLFHCLYSSLHSCSMHALFMFHLSSLFILS
jgi:hypothetical protein